MALSRKSPIFETETERRGKVQSDQPGEYHFSDQFDAVKLLQGEVRHARVPRKQLAEGGGMASSTVSNMASGKTRWPRWSTMFGLVGVMGLEVVVRRKPK